MRSATNRTSDRVPYSLSGWRFAPCRPFLPDEPCLALPCCPLLPIQQQHAGVSFSFTPLRGGGSSRGGAAAASPSFLTPSKVLLANGETRMNMLSPGLDSTKLFHADVEYGKVVSEWRFNKDEVDIPQVCVLVSCWCRGGGV